MSRAERYQANVELMEEGGELDGCEEFQLMDEELDGEAVFPVFDALWKGREIVFAEVEPNEGKVNDV